MKNSVTEYNNGMGLEGEKDDKLKDRNDLIWRPERKDTEN